MNSFTKAASHALRAVFGILASPVERSRSGRTRVGEWNRALDHVVAELEELNRSTEKDFLAVGGKLMEFLSVARRISADMTSLTGLISGETGRNASRALTRMLEGAREIDARIARSGQALESVRDYSSRIRSAFSKLGRTVSVFRTLCTLTRIETSWLEGSGSGFGDLADQIRPLSESIQSSGAGILAASHRLDQSVQSAVRRGADLSATQLTELHSLIASVMEGLQSFEERQRRAEDASVRQCAQHTAVSAAIEDLVRSVQFHDITRQQIEHVCQSLRQIRAEGNRGGETGSFPPPDVRTVLTLQSSQMFSAGLAFAESFENMQRDLNNIAARVLGMAQAGLTLLGLSAGEKDSFFLRMEGCFTGILNTVGACTAAEAATQSLASELVETIAGMRVAIREIRGVEIHIQRIAINATIRSAHIGNAGSALNVIADVMHQVACDSNRNTEAVAGALHSMSDAAAAVSVASIGTAAGPVPVTVLDEMRNAILELHTSSERSFGQVQQIATLSSRLGEEIHSVGKALSAGPVFADVVSRARAELERMGARNGPSESPSVAPQEMERFAGHYTMQAERDVHAALAAGNAAAPCLPSGDPAVLADGGMGANVELF